MDLISCEICQDLVWKVEDLLRDGNMCEAATTMDSLRNHTKNDHDCLICKKHTPNL